MGANHHHGHDHHHGHAYDHGHEALSEDEALKAEDTHYFDHIYLATSHERNAKRTMWVVWLTAATMIVEIVAGWMTGSMALLADGFHMATHAGALAVAAAAYRYARIHARDARFTFGTGKVGDLSGFASALLLGVVSLGIGVESVMRLFEPIKVDFGQATLVAVVGLIINIISAVLLMESHDHGHGHGDHDGHSHGHRDNNLRAAYVHVLADALTSILAIAALLAGRYLGWVWLDPVIGVLGAIVIAKWAWSLMGDTAAILLDTAEPKLTARVRTLVESTGATIADLHVWRIGPHAHAVIVSIEGQGNAAAIRQSLTVVQGLAHVTVECG